MSENLKLLVIIFWKFKILAALADQPLFTGLKWSKPRILSTHFWPAQHSTGWNASAQAVWQFREAIAGR